MNIQPRLEDDLYLIRALKEEDRDQLFEIASDPLIWDQHPAKERATRAGFDQFFDQSLASGGALVIIDKKLDKIIGSSRYELHKEDSKAVQIGWTYLSREYWGNGTNDKIKEMMIAHAFHYMDRVLLYIDHKNYRSQGAAKKIGAKQVSMQDYPVVYRDRPDYTTFVLEKD